MNVTPQFLIFILCIIIAVIFLLYRKGEIYRFENYNYDGKGAVVMIPGLGGSILDAKWDLEFDWKRFYCVDDESSWDQIWPTVYSAIPIVNNCWLYRVINQISDDGKKFYSASGVDIKPKDFGGLKGISVLDAIDFYFWDVPIVNYFKDTIDKLKLMGYKHLYGAPYDFRLILDQEYMDGFVNRLVKLIEKAYNETGGEKVTLISHSLGGPTTSYVLSQQSDEWKDKYIKQFIAVSGPFGGATKALESILTGVTEGIPVTDRFIRTIEKKVAGNIWMINEPKTWQNIEIVNNQGISSIKDFIIAAGEPETANAWENTINNFWPKSLKDPGVKTHLIIGNNIKTPYQLYYKDNFNNPKIIYNYAGDGTVNNISLESPHKVHGWNISSMNVVNGATHMGILNTTEYLNLLEKIME